MEILPVTPRGYCQGVVRAIGIAKKTAAEYPNTPIYMLGMIVHNRFVVDACRLLGIQCLESKNQTRLELLDQIPSGVVIFTAHGVSNAVREKAKSKGLILVDATCPDVKKTHDLILAHCNQGGEVLYIGKKNHPEAEGAVSLNPHIHLISSVEDLNALPDTLSNILITNQTTLSLLDTKVLLEQCRAKYPDAISSPEICNATTIRQEAVMNLKNVDLLIVVGDPHSNNTNQLRNIALQSGTKESILIESIEELRESMIQGKNRIAVTSGSSTPTQLTSQVITFLTTYEETGVWNPPTVSLDPMI